MICSAGTFDFGHGMENAICMLISAVCILNESRYAKMVIIALQNTIYISNVSELCLIGNYVLLV